VSTGGSSRASCCISSRSTSTRPLAPTGALLGTRGVGGPATIEVTTVTVEVRRRDELVLDGVPTARSTVAVLLEHGAEPPDLERSWGTRTTGTLEGPRLSVRSVERWGRADRMPTLLQRVRDEWALERACIAGLRANGRRV
jgi:hypothetical protein